MADHDLDMLLVADAALTELRMWAADCLRSGEDPDPDVLYNLLGLDPEMIQEGVSTHIG